MQLLPSPEYFHLVARPELGVLIGRWQRQPTLEELQAGYQALLAAAEATANRFWLVDARRRDNANQQGTPWMMSVFFPLVAARLRGPVYMAYVFTPSHLADLEADASVPPLTYFDQHPYHVQRFTSEQPAMTWLHACQQLAT